MLQMMDQKHTWNRKEHWILKYSYDIFIQLRQKFSTCKFPLAFPDGTIVAWNNPELFAWTGANIKSKEGKQRNKSKISSRGRNSTPKQQLGKWDWKDKRHTERNRVYPVESYDSTKIHVYSAVFISVTKQEGGEKAAITLLFNWRIPGTAKRSCPHRPALRGSAPAPAPARGDSEGPGHSASLEKAATQADRKIVTNHVPRGRKDTEEKNYVCFCHKLRLAASMDIVL